MTLALQYVSACILNLPRHFLHRPDGTLRAPLFGSQGGGVYVGSGGVANFEGCDIHDNAASYVCLPSALALNFHPSPHWCADRDHVCLWQGVSFPANRTHM